jgi:orotate phosphoribosyltransferase
MNRAYRDELLRVLVREAYIERRVTLASGKTSDYYLDCRRAIFLPRAAFLIGELMLDLVLAHNAEQVGGMAVAAVPVTDAIIAAAYRRGAELRGFFVRKEIKAHGLQQQIEGAFRSGLRTAVVEDTVTTGGSSLQAVAAMRDAGANVVAAIALVERGEGGADAFARDGLKYEFVFTADEIRTAARNPPA